MKKIGSVLDKYQILVLAVVFYFLTFNMHSRAPLYSYHHVLWADAAGYYVYLPAAFEYDFEAQKMEAGIGEKTGNGFIVDTSTGKIKTKYTYGVALLQLPFYLVGRVIESFKQSPENGFGSTGHTMLLIAGVFYALAGLYLLKKVLTRIYDSGTSSLSVLFLFTTTTLFYYGIDKTGFAHIYLFFLFSAAIFLWDKTIHSGKVVHTVLFYSCIVLSFIIRPTSVFAFPLIAMIHIKSFKDLSTLFLHFRNNFKSHLISALIAGVFLLPQIFYWNYLSGQSLHYSYGEEGFINLWSPRLIEIWLSPNNGLFLYSPIVVVFLVLLFIPTTRSFFTIWLFFTFLLLSWIFASWHDWSFGCSYGSRSFTEYMVFFAFPLTGFLFHLQKTGKRHFLLLTCILIAYIAFVNINTIYTYDDCFYGDTWDFDSYFRILRLF